VALVNPQRLATVAMGRSSGPTASCRGGGEGRSGHRGAKPLVAGSQAVQVGADQVVERAGRQPAGRGPDFLDPQAEHGVVHEEDPARRQARVLAVSQRPLAAAAFSETAAAAAWRTKPAWGIVSTADHTINPDVERFGYSRAGITAVEIDSSHLVMLAHPKEAFAVIRQAVDSVPDTARG
jgi:alpha/beta hydrolase family protein